MGTSEGELWERALRSDERAFTALFDLHRDRVYRHVLRIVARPHDAEDATALAFFELWRLRARVRVVEGSVLPWLLVTATNSARNLTRSSRRYAAVLESLPRTADVDDADPAVLAAERAAERETADRVRGALAGLRPVDANLLLLVVVGEVRIGDAAAVLGIAEGTARTRLSRAKARARALLDDGTAAQHAVVRGGVR